MKLLRSPLGARTLAVGMLHVPINTVIASPREWRAKLGLPQPTPKDWEIIRTIESLLYRSNEAGSEATFQLFLSPPNDVAEAEQMCSELSFISFLEGRMLTEVDIYFANNFDAVLLENVAAPYFVRGSIPAVIPLVMSRLARRLRAEYPDKAMGIQLLAFADNLAIEIAVRADFEFIRAESVLFSGLRPEGETPNRGNLAKLYMTREMLVALERRECWPRVCVDVRKKHTVFVPALEIGDRWLDNILFQKLEGIVITGRGTGVPVEEQELRETRTAINRFADETRASIGEPWVPQLFVGSGVSISNIGLCKKYADAAIIGSSLKSAGYWENPVDVERVKAFAEAWSR